ncbi:primosomal protein N' [Pseudarthrobacter sp. J1738]|uniref:primosomal protein N' n=1 Tax=Pseudarthrobacter sp. J1738 TaxID=3420446 RepID=UPI003D2DC0B3
MDHQSRSTARTSASAASVEATNAEYRQPSLLQGFSSPKKLPAKAGVPLATDLPIARVVIESSLPHLDRTFDYWVPASMADTAQAGVRVKVPFSGRDVSGFVVGRVESSEAERDLVPLGKLISPVPALSEDVVALCESVAARYAGTLSDVIRLAVPPRVAGVEKEYLVRYPGVQAPSETLDIDLPESSGWDAYTSGAAFLAHLREGHSPRAVLSAAQGYGVDGWPELLAQAAATVRASGRTAVLVVPDQRDLARLEAAMLELLPASDIARLTGEDGPTIRYGHFMRLLHGEAGVAIGTRSAAYAPVKNLGLVVCWDDGDDLHLEQRAPYPHAREVLLLRAGLSNAAVLLAAHSRSTEAQRLVESRWANSITAPRNILRTVTARVVNTADSFQQERDPLAAIARMPHVAWQSAKEALDHGPVLVQVARSGYSPTLLCTTCREPARCTHCQGPLAVTAAGNNVQQTPLPQCRWCSTPEPQFTCQYCQGHGLQMAGSGALRTAEELGRAFPGATVVNSSGEHVKSFVKGKRTLVVATVGAEPVAEDGYAAALLLDGNMLLRRESLRAGEDTVRRWFNAAALVRPAKDGGVIVVTADDEASVGALLRWDPAGFASRELELRRDLGLPPAVRVAALTGPRPGVEHLTQALTGELSLRVAGPAAAPGNHAAVSDAEDEVRTLVFIPYAQAAKATGILRAAKAASAAKRTHQPVQVRLDGVDVL